MGQPAACCLTSLHVPPSSGADAPLASSATTEARHGEPICGGVPVALLGALRGDGGGPRGPRAESASEEEGEEEDVTSGDEQEQCFAFEPELEPWDREDLYEQFDRFPSPRAVRRAWKVAAGPPTIGAEKITPPTLLNYRPKTAPMRKPGGNYTTLEHLPGRSQHVWRLAGLRAMRRGKVAVVLSATCEERGLTAPDAVLASSDLGLPSRKSIFQVLFERLRRLLYLAARSEANAKGAVGIDARVRGSAPKCSIPVYIMCSTETRGVVEEYLRGNRFFGVPAADVNFFVAQDLPVMDSCGRYLLKKKSEIWRLPSDGGGVFDALRDAGVLHDLRTRPVEYLYLCESTNLLCRIADPLLVGVAIHTHVEVALKCIEKRSPHEDLPVFATIGQPPPRADLTPTELEEFQRRAEAEMRPIVMRPEQLTDRMRFERDKADLTKLRLRLGSIAELLVQRPFVDVAVERRALLWRRKEVPMQVTISPYTGKPERRRAFQLEQHLEDIAAAARSAVALCVDREGHCARVSGDPTSPMLACAALSSLHQSWLLQAGARFLGDARVDMQGSLLCEISPLVSYEGEGLLRRYPEELSLPVFIRSRFEFEALVPPSPLAGRAQVAPGAPQEGAEWDSAAEAQVPVRPTSRSRRRVIGLSPELSPDDSEDSAADDPAGTGLIGAGADDMERMEDDPMEEIKFRQAVFYAQKCAQVAEQIQHGQYRGELKVDMIAEKMRQLLRNVAEDQEAAGKAVTAGVHHDDEDMDEVASAASGSDIETMIQHLVGGDDSVSVHSSDSSLSAGGSAIKKAHEAAKAARKKARTKYYFTKLGPSHHFYQTAAAVRCKRIKIYGGDYYDENLPSKEPLEPRELQALQKLRCAFLDYDPERLAEHNWFEPGQAKRKKEKKLSAIQKGACASSRDPALVTQTDDTHTPEASQPGGQVHAAGTGIRGRRQGFIAISNRRSAEDISVTQVALRVTAAAHAADGREPGVELA